MTAPKNIRASVFVAGAVLAAALLLSASPASARLAGSEVRDNLAAAEQAFHRAMDLDRTDPEAARAYYQDAILNFERIVNEGGVRNGSLYYDIGNAYFRLGDLGRAILNYRRSGLYMPNDPNLKQNLEYARNRRADRIERTEQENVYRTLFFVHYDVPSRAKLIIFAACFAAVWVSAGLRLFVRAGSLKAVLVIAAVASGIFLASLAVDAVSFESRPPGVITASEVTGRMGDADSYQPSFKEPLHAGTEFKLLEKRADWWRIELDSGETTWIPTGSADLVL
jgi:tetratricopeptide (TPR) repeat protein